MISNLARAANIVVILITLLAYLAPHLHPERFWVFSVLGTGFPFLLFINVLFILFWIISKKRYFLFSLFCLIIGWKYVKTIVGMSFSSDNSPSKTEIKVLSWNISGIILNNYKPNKEQGYTALSKFFAKENPDVICLQEFGNTDKATDKIYQKIPALANYTYKFREPQKTQILLSKFPILSKGVIDFGNTGNGCAYADLDIQGKTVRFYSTHLESNKITVTADKVLEERKFEDKETWGDIKSIFGRVRRFSKTRAVQVQKLKENILSNPNPSIVCGDFNETPLSYPYTVISELLNDSFVEKGFGMGTTFNGSIPLLRIDYIFADKRFNVKDFDTKKVDFSDHFPVVSTIDLK